MIIKQKQRAPRNQTIVLTDDDFIRLRNRLNQQDVATLPLSPEGIWNGNFSDFLPKLPDSCVDLLFLDPPYNLNKSFNGKKFSKLSVTDYTGYLKDIFKQLLPCLKPTATIYICGDWLTSHSIFEAASYYFTIRNRITWEREKGRGAKTNWKNSNEDIWFCTASDDYYFDVDRVKLRRQVIAPYKNADGTPKDWDKTKTGNFRDTCPSNLWTDISIPFWSMPENTDHPTQKSEKLLAKLLLASSKPYDLVLDPFLGSGTTAVAAKKLNRRYLGFEIDEEYALLSLRRIEMAEKDVKIQGYSDGVFWERNTFAKQGNSSTSKPKKE